MGQSDKNATFVFRRRSEPINWKQLAAVDVEKISQELDIQTLQNNIANVTFCRIELEFDSKTLDLNFIKLYKLAQLIIEYLLYSQNYLANEVKSLETKCQDLEEKLALEEKEKAKLQLTIQELKKENKRRKKMLQEQQQQQFTTLAESSFKCTNCPKAFINSAYLNEHVHRRHPNVPPLGAVMFPHGEQQQPSIVGTILEQQLEDVHKRLRETENLLAEERNLVNQLKSKGNNEVKEEELWKNLEDWKQEQAAQSKKDLDSFSSLFMKELKHLQEFHIQSIQDMQHRTLDGDLKTSNITPELGEEVREAIHKEKEDIQNLKVQLKDQMVEMESYIQKRLKQQENEWMSKLKNLNEAHSAEREKFETALVESGRLLEKERHEKRQERKKLQMLVRQLPKQSDDYNQTFITQSNNVERYSPSPVQTESPELSPVRNVVSQPSFRNTPSRPSSSINESGPSNSLKIIKVGSLHKEEESLSKSSVPDNKRATKTTTSKEKLQDAIDNNPQLLDGLKEEIHGLLQDEMKQWGIDDGAGVSNEIYKRKSAALAREKNKLLEKYKNFVPLKRKLQKTLEEKLSVALINMSPKPHTSWNYKSKSATEVKQKQGFTPSTPVKRLTFTQPEMQILGKKSSSLESCSDESSYESEDNSDEDVRPPRVLSPVIQDIRPIESSTPIKPLLAKDHLESSDSEDDESDAERARPRLEEPIKLKQPTGKKVAQLASSIERQLTRRTEIKPPAGAVDIMHRPKPSNQVHEISKKSTMYGSDISVSSLDDVAPLKNLKEKPASESLSKTFRVSPHHGKSVDEKFLPLKKTRKTSWDSDLSIEDIT